MEYAILKKIYLGTLTTTAKTDIYTVNATKGTSIIRELIVHNTDTENDVVFTLYINDKVFVKASISPGDNLFIGRDWYLVLETDDKISAQASKGNVLNVYMGGSETIK